MYITSPYVTNLPTYKDDNPSTLGPETTEHLQEALPWWLNDPPEHPTI